MNENLKELKLAVEIWRSQKRSHSERMPTELRKKIMELRKDHNDYEICKAIGLSNSYFSPKKSRSNKKVKINEPRTKSPQFVQISTADPVDKASLIFKLQNGISIEVFK